MENGYPKTKYHVRGGGSVLITSSEQEKSLGPEWIDNKPIRNVAASLGLPALEPLKASDKKYGRLQSKHST